MVDFNAIVSAHAAGQLRATETVTPDQWTYKGWSISYDYPPIPIRSFDWSASSPDYDCDGDSEGFRVCSGGQVHAATYEELLEEIEAYIAEEAA